MRLSLSTILLSTALAFALPASAASRRAVRAHRPQQKLVRIEHVGWGIRLGLALALIGLYRSWKRNEDQGSEGGGTGAVPTPEYTPAPARNFVRAVHVDKGGRNFDAGATNDHLIQRFEPKFEAVPARLSATGTPTMSLDEPEAPAYDEDAELISLRGPRAAAPGGFGGDINAQLPLGLREHFDRVAGEAVIWTAPIDIPLRAQGKVAITSHRLVAAYRQHTLDLFPPARRSGVRRNSTPIGAVGRVGLASERRARFLAVGAVTCLWYPLGSMVTVVCIALFFFARRPVLTVYATGYGTRRFPLDLVDAKEAQKFLSRVRARAQAPVKKGA